MHRGSGSLGFLAAGSLVLGACGSDSTPPVTVASVTVSPAAQTVMVGDTTRFIATVKDAAGHVLTDRAVTWSSSNAGAATISATGLVAGVAAATVTITATSEGVSGSATITVIAPVPTVSYASVEAGTYHSCGRTPAGAAYCWGDNNFGELGDGTTMNALTPVAVSGALSFGLVSVGGNNSCGLTAGGAAYCWGYDVYGALGAGAPGPEICTGSEGSYPCSHRPLAVAGGLAFATLSANWGLVCGLDGSGGAYCWGDNRFGQLGVDTSTAPDRCDSSPVGGQPLGPCSRTPLPVPGGLTFTRLSVGYAHSCGLATGGAWYCWGVNNYGQLGNGTTGPEMCRIPQGDYPCSTRPVAVTGGVSFTTVFPGGRRHGCGVTAAGVAYCWGDNDGGKLGDGTTTSSLTPVTIAGGLKFTSVSPYIYHTCGLSTAGVAYCWGHNTWGDLGDGTTNASSVPVRVAGQTGTAASAATVRTDAVERRRVPHPPLRPTLP